MPKKAFARIHPADGNPAREDVVVTHETSIYNSSEVLVKIQSQYPAHLIYKGQVSGRLYEWKKAGDVLSVLEEDVFELLSKRLGSRSCCGGSNTDGNQVFKLFIE